MKGKYYLYTETAFHHEGDFDYMITLIDHSVKSHADGIKFQVLMNFDELISKLNPGYEKLKSYTFSETQWRKIFDYTKSKGLDLIVMPLDIKSFEVFDEYKSSIRYLELHSVSFYDNAVKAKIKASGIDLILGVGGRTLEELYEAQNYFGDQLKIFMTGFQAFPSQIADIKLRRIQEIRKMFPAVSVGYADHSGFSDEWAVKSNEVAYLLGATVFEKHLTVDEGKSRVDFESAVGTEKILQIREKLDALAQIAFDENVFEMTPAEINYRNRQKLAVASRNLQKGHLLSASDFYLKMVGNREGIAREEELIGKSIINDIAEDQLIRKEDVNQ